MCASACTPIILISHLLFLSSSRSSSVSAPFPSQTANPSKPMHHLGKESCSDSFTWESSVGTTTAAPHQGSGSEQHNEEPLSAFSAAAQMLPPWTRTASSAVDLLGLDRKESDRLMLTSPSLLALLPSTTGAAFDEVAPTLAEPRRNKTVLQLCEEQVHRLNHHVHGHIQHSQVGRFVRLFFFFREFL